MAARIFLGLSALIWLPYGIFCFFSPEFLAGEGSAGLVASTATGSTELRAMYGGLQVAIGALVGLAVFRPRLVQPALLMTAFLTTGLATARLTGALIDGGFSGYTFGGLGFEIVSACIAWWLLQRGAEPAAQPA
jgi:hypothetical protein